MKLLRMREQRMSTDEHGTNLRFFRSFISIFFIAIKRVKILIFNDSLILIFEKCLDYKIWYSLIGTVWYTHNDYGDDKKIFLEKEKSYRITVRKKCAFTTRRTTMSLKHLPEFLCLYENCTMHIVTFINNFFFIKFYAIL